MTAAHTHKITGAEGIIAAVPTLLGFHPTDSIVVVGMIGKRVGPTARIDLAQADALGQVGDALARHCDGAIVVVYSADELAVLRVDTAALGLPLLGLYSTDNAPATPDAGLTAANALLGRRALADRAQLAASVAYNPDAPHAPIPFRRGKAARDGFLTVVADGGREEAARWLPLLLPVLANTPDRAPRLADVAAVTAAVAYLAGDGALANVALDRALAADQDHRLAMLMVATINAAVAPAELAAALAG